MSDLRIRGRLLLGTMLAPGEVVVEGDLITGVRRVDASAHPPASPEEPIVAPGFIDLQVNGAFGHDIAEDPRSIGAIARRLTSTGVTSFLPTLISSSIDTYRAAFSAFTEIQATGGARPLGWHLEGPALSTKRAGAHPVKCLVSPDSPIMHELLTNEHIRLVTVAPELPGALDLVACLRDRGIIVSLGHSDATFDEYRSGADAGASMATHLFNAMSPFGHRAPAATGAALVEDRLTAGLIADGIHCHQGALELAFRAKGPDKIALVSDMVAAAGMPDGVYHLGGMETELRDGAVRRSDGTLAGSALCMDEAVRNMVRWTSATVPQALSMASEVPARILGLHDVGRIEVGCRADLVVLDDRLRVQRCMVGGEWMNAA